MTAADLRYRAAHGPPGWTCKPKDWGYVAVQRGTGRDTTTQETPERCAEAVRAILGFRGVSLGRGSGRECPERRFGSRIREKERANDGRGLPRLREPLTEHPRRVNRGGESRQRHTPSHPEVEVLEHPALTGEGRDTSAFPGGERIL